jgi:hypothetical protein
MKRISEKSKVDRKQIIQWLNDQKDGEYSIEVKKY